MVRYILARTAQAVVSLLAVTVFIFGIVRLSGDPLQVLLPPEASREQYDEMRRLLLLDQPLYVQYGTWLSHVVVGDFGQSTRHRLPVSELIAGRLPATLQLAAVAFPLTMLLGLGIGVYAAAWRGSSLDLAARTFAVIGQAAPSFWMGIVLIMVFGVWLHVLPAGGKNDWTSYILPALTLGWYPVAGVMRLTRSSMIEVLGSEYIKLARVKGVSEQSVLWKHAFKNAALPVLTFAALVFIFMVGGSVIVETVFAWPGIGPLALEAIYNRDFPIVEGVVMLFSSWVIIGNLVVDVLYAYLNPRIRY
jgi:peptide/nickel transport system permease protein